MNERGEEFAGMILKCAVDGRLFGFWIYVLTS